MAKNLLACFLFAVVAWGCWPWLRSAAAAESDGPMLAHNVFFSLSDNSDAAKEKLVAACKKYLSGHPGAVSFAVGVRDRMRPAGERSRLRCRAARRFQNKAAHDQYQKAERHLKFIAENKDNWKKVRVFDEYVGG